MDREKQLLYSHKYNLVLSIYMVASFILQFLIVAIGLNLVFVISILWGLTSALFFINILFGGLLLFFILFKKRKDLSSRLLWAIANQFGLIISFIVLFASGMTVGNL